jgi:hypothetical protein
MRIMSSANPSRLVDLRVRADALDAAAERANEEQRSLTDVVTALLRDYAAGRTWLNTPTEEGSEDARLRAAEEVCLMYGWTGASHETERGKALYELWSHWVNVSGVSMSPADHPEMSDERIAELARQRDEIRARTLARIRELGDQEASGDAG